MTHHERKHHELAGAGPQAVAILAAGAAIYGGRLAAWLIGKVRRNG